MFQESHKSNQYRKRKKWIHSLSVLSSEEEEEVDMKSEKIKTLYNDEIIAIRFPYPMFSDDSEDNQSSDSSPNESAHINLKNKKLRAKSNASKENWKDRNRPLQKKRFKTNLNNNNTNTGLSNHRSSKSNDSHLSRTSSKHLRRILLSSSENSSSEEIEHSVKSKSSYCKKSLKAPRKGSESVGLAVQVSKPISIKRQTNKLTYQNLLDSSSESLTDENEFKPTKPISTSGINQAPRFRRLHVLSSSPSCSDIDEETNKSILPSTYSSTKPSNSNFRTNYSRKRKIVNSVVHSISSSSDEEENARTFASKKQRNINSQDKPPKQLVNKNPFKNLLTLSESGLNKSKDLQVGDDKLSSATTVASEYTGYKSSSNSQRSIKFCDPKPLARTAWTSIANAPLKSNTKTLSSSSSHNSKIKALKKHFISSNASSVEISKKIQSKTLKSFIPKRSESLKQCGGRFNKVNKKLQVPTTYEEERENIEERKLKENNYTVNVNVFCSPTQPENTLVDKEEYSTSKSTSSSQKLDINLSLSETEGCDRNTSGYSKKVRISHAANNQNNNNQIEVIHQPQLTQKETQITSSMNNDNTKTTFEENHTGCDVLGNILSQMENNRYKVQRPPTKNPIEPPSEMLGRFPVGVNPPFVFQQQQNQQHTSHIQTQNFTIDHHNNIQSSCASAVSQSIDPQVNNLSCTSLVSQSIVPQVGNLVHKTNVPHSLPSNKGVAKSRWQNNFNYKEHSYSFDKIKKYKGQRIMPFNRETSGESRYMREKNNIVIKTNNFKPHISSVTSLAGNNSGIDSPNSICNEISEKEILLNKTLSGDGSTDAGRNHNHNIENEIDEKNNKDDICDGNLMANVPTNTQVDANDSLIDIDPLTYLYDEPLMQESLHSSVLKDNNQEIRKDFATNELDNKEKDTSKGIRIRLEESFHSSVKKDNNQEIRKDFATNEQDNEEKDTTKGIRIFEESLHSSVKKDNNQEIRKDFATNEQDNKERDTSKGIRIRLEESLHSSVKKDNNQEIRKDFATNEQDNEEKDTSKGIRIFEESLHSSVKKDNNQEIRKDFATNEQDNKEKDTSKGIRIRLEESLHSSVKKDNNQEIRKDFATNEQDNEEKDTSKGIRIFEELLHSSVKKDNNQEIRKDFATNEQDNKEKDTSKGIRIRLGGAVFRVQGNSTLTREDRKTEVSSDHSLYPDKDEGKIPITLKDSLENMVNHTILSKSNQVTTLLHKGNTHEDIKKKQPHENHVTNTPLHTVNKHEEIKKAQPNETIENDGNSSTSSSDNNSDDSDSGDDSDKLAIREDDSSSDSSDSSSSSSSSSTVKSRTDLSNIVKSSSKENIVLVNNSNLDNKISTIVKHKNDSEDISKVLLLESENEKASRKDLIIIISSSDSENDESDNTKLINTNCNTNKVTHTTETSDKTIHSARTFDKKSIAAPSSEKETITNHNSEKGMTTIPNSVTKTTISQFPEKEPNTTYDSGNSNVSVIKKQQNHKTFNTIGKIRVKSFRELGIIANNPLPENALPSVDQTPIIPNAINNLPVQPTTLTVNLSKNKISEVLTSQSKMDSSKPRLTEDVNMEMSSNNKLTANRSKTPVNMPVTSTVNQNKLIVLIPVSYSNTTGTPTLETPNSYPVNSRSDVNANHRSNLHTNLNENLHAAETEDCLLKEPTLTPVVSANCQQRSPKTNGQTSVQPPPTKKKSKLNNQPSAPNTTETEALFFKLCDELFTELVHLKIPKLVDELHLSIVYDIIKEERLKKLEQLISPETIAAEKRRAVKDCAETIKIRGQSFVPLFMTVVNKINKANLKALVTALYCRFVHHLERIDPVNANYRFKLRHIIRDILQKHSTDGDLKEAVCSIFGEDTTVFVTNFMFIENLLFKYDKYLEERQKFQCNVTIPEEMRIDSNAPCSNQPSSSTTSTTVASKHSHSSAEEEQGSCATATKHATPSGPPIGNLDQLIFNTIFTMQESIKTLNKNLKSFNVPSP